MAPPMACCRRADKGRPREVNSKPAICSKAVAASILRLIELLDGNEDVQDVFANYEMPAAWLDELAGS